MAVTTTSAPMMKLSFADIVKGSTEPTPPTPLKPAARGEKRCFCQGEILVMLGHYGWIMAFDDIDHPDLGMTAGRVYLNKRDVVDGSSLAKGDIVSFYLYADDQGLGAEDCQLDQSTAPGMSADAAEFVPAEESPPTWNVCATAFVPSSTITPYSFSVQAAEFVPSQFSFMKADVPEFVPAAAHSNMVPPNPNVMYFNPAFLSDDESDDESIVSKDDFSGNEGDKESNGGDKESSCDESPESFHDEKDFDSGSDLDVVVLHAPLKLKSGQASSGDDSTSVGGWSDSEDETVVHCAMRAPPGLSLPAGWRPPPGLSLPVFAA